MSLMNEDPAGYGILLSYAVWGVLFLVAIGVLTFIDWVKELI